MSDATHAYVGRNRQCGHVRAAVIDVPGYEKFTAEEVRSFIGSGLVVERVTEEEARACFADKCDICEPPKKQAGLFA